MPQLLKEWLTNAEGLTKQGRKLAVVIGPGGNAGVITSGYLSAILKLYRMPQAHYIGTSVGAYNWLYLLIGNNFEAPTVYGRFYCDNRFINPLRIITKRPVLNLDYVLGEIAEQQIPINYHAAQISPYKVSALTTGAEGDLHLLPLTGVNKEAAAQALRATASMPLIGRIHNLQESSHWDGWITEPFLPAWLKAEGFTDLIWFLNRPLKENVSWKERQFYNHIVRTFRKHNPSFAAKIKQRLKTEDFLALPPQGLHLEVFTPHTEISASSRNAPGLFHALGTSYNWMATYLGHPNLPYPEEWKPYIHHMPK